ncbi:hypothetical protein VNO78_13002 [Psophocarpus tetragonolobus]|uniref:Uncharacterized protein n=1 Tax=Psophocarpus tetragonolobus TaxID=3891 RepID=A0AAN9SRT3_PSOTE
METKHKGKVEDGELLHHNNNDSIVLDGSLLDSIRPDYFSFVNQDLNPNSNSICSSNSSSEVNRNFDDSYVASQLFPFTPWNVNSNVVTTNTTTIMVESNFISEIEEVKSDLVLEIEEEKC